MKTALKVIFLYLKSLLSSITLSKKLYILLLIYFICTNSFSQYPVTINTVRYLSDYPDGTDITNILINTIATSVNGDVIVLPQGKFKITGQIDIINKDISIIGHGADSITGTMLYKTSVSHMNWFFNYSNTSNDFNSYYFVSGIYLKSIKNSTILNNGVQFNRSSNWILSDNTIQYVNTWSVLCYHQDSISGFNGLMFHNNILDSYVVELHNYAYGSGSGGQSDKWISDPEFGSNKFVFIEDNYFYRTRHAVASSATGKYVFRYNTVRDNWVTSAVDMHGAGAFGNSYSARAAEIYGNDIETTIDSYGELITEATAKNHYTQAIGIRGGEALVYSNTVGNYMNYLGLSLEEVTPESYPSPYQIGYSSGLKYGSSDIGIDSDHGNGDVFWWNPIYKEKYPDWGWDTLYISSVDLTYIKKNRDAHNKVKPGYSAYPYPHPWRNYYYTFIDNFIDSINIPTVSNFQPSSITLNWNDVIGEDGYYIYMSTDGNKYSKIDSTGLNVISKTIWNLNPGTTYYFYINAYNDTHEGEGSGVLIASTLTGSISLPVFQSAVIENANPERLEMTYSLTLAKIVPAGSAFSVKVNSVARVVSSVALSGTKVILTLASPVVFGDVVTVAYSKPESNPLQTDGGGQAVTIPYQSVANNCMPPANKPPIISISSPNKSVSFESPATITIDAIAYDPDGKITKVEFFNGNAKLGEKTIAPYSYTWKDITNGTYYLTAIATDNLNSKTVSDAVAVTVLKMSSAVNQLPFVSITSPGRANKFKKNDNIVIEVEASDPDGMISKVELKSGNVRLAEMTTSPYLYTLENVDTGNYKITAIATDNLGATATSPIFELIVDSFYDGNLEIINLYPNPNNGQFSTDLFSSLQGKINKVTITSLTGKVIYNGKLMEGENTQQFDLSDSSPGTYILTVYNNSVIVTTKVFIKN